MVKINLYVLVILGLLCSCKTAKESKAISLFNGKDLNGWHVDVPEMDKDTALQSPFLVRNGMRVSMGTPNGHIITDAEYENFKLEVEYRFAGVPGNCGVLVFASMPRALYEMFPKSIEVQMMHENDGDFWCIVEDITPIVPTRAFTIKKQATAWLKTFILNKFNYYLSNAIRPNMSMFQTTSKKTEQLVDSQYFADDALFPVINSRMKVGMEQL